MNRGQDGTLHVREILFILLSLGMLAGPIATAQEPQNAPNAPNAGAVPENPTPAEQRPVPSSRGKLMNIKGEVTGVDAGAGSIKIKEGVKEKTKEHTVGLTDKTIVTAGKIKKSITDINPGDKVVARVLEEDGKMTARSIRLAREGRKGSRESVPETESPGRMDETPKPAEPGQVPNETPESPTTGP